MPFLTRKPNDPDPRHGFSEDDIWHEMRHLGCDEQQAIKSLTDAEARLDD